MKLKRHTAIFSCFTVVIAPQPHLQKSHGKQSSNSSNYSEIAFVSERVFCPTERRDSRIRVKNQR